MNEMFNETSFKKKVVRCNFNELWFWWGKKRHIKIKSSIYGERYKVECFFKVNTLTHKDIKYI